jgi:hypothetical protein
MTTIDLLQFTRTPNGIARKDHSIVYGQVQKGCRALRWTNINDSQKALE